jgi:hypothetical protein
VPLLNRRLRLEGIPRFRSFVAAPKVGPVPDDEVWECIAAQVAGAAGSRLHLGASGVDIPLEGNLTRLSRAVTMLPGSAIFDASGGGTTDAHVIVYKL